MLQFNSLVDRVMEPKTISKNGASSKSLMSRGSNSMKRFFSYLLLFAVIVVLCDCSNRILDFTLISTKNVDLTKGASFKRGSQRVRGVDKAHWIILFPTKSVSIKEAIDKAIESTPGCVALLDGVIYTKFWWIPYIYGQQSASIEGTPLIDITIADYPNEAPIFGKIELDKNGNVKNVENISELEYNYLKRKVIKDSKRMRFEHSSEI